MNRTVLTFDWSPKGSAVSFTIGGQTYPYSHQADNISRTSDIRYQTLSTPARTNLTFVANVIPASGRVIVEYKWKLGDGTVQYGQSITHSYKNVVEQTDVTLIVTDDLGNRSIRNKVINLVAPTS